MSISKKDRKTKTSQQTQETNVVINVYIQEFGRFTFTEVLGRIEKSEEIEAFLPYTFPESTGPSYIAYSFE